MANTKAAGAVIERALVQRRIARMKIKKSASEISDFGAGFNLALTVLSDWIRSQPVRLKKPGGIGRK